MPVASPTAVNARNPAAIEPGQDIRMVTSTCLFGIRLFGPIISTKAKATNIREAKMRTIAWTALLAALAALNATSAGAAELKLFGGGHFQGSGKPLVAAFSSATGIAASYTPGNTGGGGMKKRLNAGEKMDVVVLNRDDMDNQVKAGLIRAGSVVDFARDGMGVAVLKGAPKPDISTRDKFRAALLGARTVGVQEADPAHHSGVVVRQMLVDLGILDQVMKKAVILGSRSDLVAGRAEFSFWALPEILEQANLDLVGPVPAELGGFTVQSVGILTGADNPADAQAFIRFLTSAEARAVWTRTGLLPLD
jgi:molybdate transport system substrate-binding protein